MCRISDVWVYLGESKTQVNTFCANIPDYEASDVIPVTAELVVWMIAIILFQTTFSCVGLAMIFGASCYYMKREKRPIGYDQFCFDRSFVTHDHC